MRAVVALLLVAVVTARVAPLSESEYQRQFVEFIDQYSKSYKSEEFFAKYNTFKFWVDYVREHNAGNSTWEAGINEFSDLTPAEFEKIYLTGLLPFPEETTPAPLHQVDLSQLPNDIDWRGKAVTPVKNQGQCGSCWAFSATGAMEGYAATKKGSLPSLSESQLVDCAGSAGNQGCNGGWPYSAIGWAARSGSCSESAYPYVPRQQTCKKCTATFTPPGYKQGSSEGTLASQLGQFPISIALDASGGFQSYKGGVFNGPCGTQLNHAVLAVGYTSSYWIVKNSWGGGWGSGGYIYMARGRNLCGLSQKLAWVG